MKAGRLDTKITIQSISRTQNAAGEMVETLATFHEPFAEVTYIRGQETEVSQAQVGLQQARFRIRHLAGLKMEFKIVHASLTWDITDIRPQGRNDEIWIIAQAVRN